MGVVLALRNFQAITDSGEIQLCANWVVPSGFKHLGSFGTTDEVGANCGDGSKVVRRLVLLSDTVCAVWG